jgi:hypothetical protein
VTTLGAYIDNGCENLKTITVKSTKLNAENCGVYTRYYDVFGSGYKAPFGDESEKETIKVPKKKLTEYKKILGEGKKILGVGWIAKITYETF